MRALYSRSPTGAWRSAFFSHGSRLRTAAHSSTRASFQTVLERSFAVSFKSALRHPSPLASEDEVGMILVTMAVNNPSATPRSGRCDGASSHFSSSCASSYILCSRQKSSHVGSSAGSTVFSFGASVLPLQSWTRRSTMFPFKSRTSGSTMFPSRATSLFFQITDMGISKVPHRTNNVSLQVTSVEINNVFPDINCMERVYRDNLSSPKPGHTTGGSRQGARRGGGAGSSRTVCQQNCSPREQSFLALPKASKTRRRDVSRQERTSEILCKPMEEQNPRLTTGSSAVYQRFMTGTRSALSSWLPTSGTTPYCLCKPFSCKACPGKRRRSTGRQPGRKSASRPGHKPLVIECKRRPT